MRHACLLPHTDQPALFSGDLLFENFPNIGDDRDPRTVFLELRELCNSW